MRLSQAEKMEIIRIVEGSELSVRRTLKELGVNHSTFYGWYRRYLSGELRDYLSDRGIPHTRGAPYHPMTQGKIERYHRSLKNLLTLQHYYYPWELEAEMPASWTTTITTATTSLSKTSRQPMSTSAGITPSCRSGSGSNARRWKGGNSRT